MSRKSCVCKYFPNPVSENCLDFEFGGKKACDFCSFSTVNPYPKTSFDMMDEDYLESVALGYESTDVNYISSLKKISYDHFNDQAVMAHGLLHARMLSAIRFGETEMVNGCLQKGLNVNNGWNSEDGEWSYLHDAASGLKYEIMKLLIDAGANVNSIDYEGETPLFLMVRNVQKLDFIGSKILFDAGADPNFCNFRGITPQTDCISLLSNGSQQLKLYRKKKMVLELLTLFLENGGDLTSMLDLARSGCCDSRLYRLFLKAGADPYLKSTEGHNALYYLKQRDCECSQLVKSIRILNNATTMSLEKTNIELPNWTECSICCSGNKTNFCQTQCCHQPLHFGCFSKWSFPASNTVKSGSFCRSIVKKVDMRTIQPVFNPVNVSKKSSERGLIFSYLFETKINQNSGEKMYKRQ